MAGEETDVEGSEEDDVKTKKTGEEATVRKRLMSHIRDVCVCFWQEAGRDEFVGESAR